MLVVSPAPGGGISAFSDGIVATATNVALSAFYDAGKPVSYLLLSSPSPAGYDGANPVLSGLAFLMTNASGDSTAASLMPTLPPGGLLALQSIGHTHLRVNSPNGHTHDGAYSILALSRAPQIAKSVRMLPGATTTAALGAAQNVDLDAGGFTGRYLLVTAYGPQGYDTVAADVIRSGLALRLTNDGADASAASVMFTLPVGCSIILDRAGYSHIRYDSAIDHTDDCGFSHCNVDPAFAEIL